ncbi:MAG TPA: hypothetical protein VGJ05_05755 [Fimbriiglobus sp.]|jgi:hypothetical protein
MKRIRPLLLVLFLGLPARAADRPAETLLKLVPDDAAVCVVVRDLRGHSTRLAESPFAAWFARSPLGRQLGGDDGLKKLADAQKFLTGVFGISAEQLRDDVLGDAVVFAFTPGPADRPQADRSLLLIKPRTPAVLAVLLAKIDAAQLAAGELTAVTTRTHNGATYSRREKKAGGAEYHALVNGIFAFSGDESTVTGVLDRIASPNATSPAAVSLARLNADQSLLAVWLNPRAFDAAFAAKAAAATDPKDRHGIETVAAIWKGVSDAAVLVNLADDLTVTLAARFDPAALPPSVRPFLLPTAGRSTLAAVVPQGAVLSILGRTKADTLLTLADTLTPPGQTPRPKDHIERDLGPVVGKDKLPAVLEALGPDWGFWAVAPEPDIGWAPEWTLAVKVGAAKPGRALLSAADTAAQLIRVGYNQAHADQIEIREETRDGTIVKSLANPEKFPVGFNPAYALKGGFFVVASSPAVVGKFRAPSEAAIPADADAIIHLSAARLREYLTRHKEPVAAFLAENQGLKLVDVRAELDRAIAILEPFDAADVLLTGKNDVTRLTLRLKTVKPLKK